MKQNELRKLKQKLLILGMTGVLVTSVGACAKRGSNASDGTTISSENQKTISDLDLDCLREENIVKFSFVSQRDDSVKSYEELLEEYKNAYNEEDFNTCNLVLYKIGRLIMQYKLSFCLETNPGLLEHFNIGKITVCNNDVDLDIIKDEYTVSFLYQGDAYNCKLDDKFTRALACHTLYTCESHYHTSLEEFDEVVKDYSEALNGTWSLQMGESQISSFLSKNENHEDFIETNAFLYCKKNYKKLAKMK